MEGYNMNRTPDNESPKRRRPVEDVGNHGGHRRQKSTASQAQLSSPIATRPNSLNYISREGAGRLTLLPGDNETFADVLNLVAEYENVLEQQESLAATLGAKLTGPRILKGIERFFDGPIKTTTANAYTSPITWVDVVLFAKANPQNFTLVTLPTGHRCCQFMTKGVHVEITEDDWRLISSGALDSFPLDHPFEEDEAAELATLDILEQRATMLFRRADEVAGRARNLHRKFGYRKQEISQRRQSPRNPHASASPIMRSPITPSYDLHADLMQQFRSSRIRSDSSASLPHMVSIPGYAPAPPSHSRSQSQSHPQLQQQSQLPAQQQQYEVSPQRPQKLALQTYMQPLPPFGHQNQHNSQPPEPVQRPTASTALEPEEENRLLMTQRTDRLQRGDPISPPCDRCRRLKLSCVKHLTACQGCTKKHARCSWRALNDEEACNLRQDVLGKGPEGQTSNAQVFESHNHAKAAHRTELPSMQGKGGGEAKAPSSAPSSSPRSKGGTGQRNIRVETSSLHKRKTSLPPPSVMGLASPLSGGNSAEQPRQIPPVPSTGPTATASSQKTSASPPPTLAKILHPP